MSSSDERYNIHIDRMVSNWLFAMVVRVVVEEIGPAVSKKTDTKWNSSTFCGTASQKCGTVP